MLRSAIYLAVTLLALAFLPLPSLSNKLQFDAAQCPNASLIFETSETFQFAGCVKPISTSEVYNLQTSTVDPPSPGWKTLQYAHLDTYSDSGCQNKLYWNRYSLSGTKPRFTAWGNAYYLCELNNGSETFFVKTVATGDVHNAYETKKCVLDLYAGDRYYFVTCIRSSTSSIITPPAGASTPGSNGTSSGALEGAFWVIAVVTFCVFFM